MGYGVIRRLGNLRPKVNYLLINADDRDGRFFRHLPQVIFPM